MKISRAALFASVVMTLQMALAHREYQDPFWSVVEQSEDYEARRREERARDYSFGHSKQDRDFFHTFRLDLDEEASSGPGGRIDAHQDPVEERILRMYQAGKQYDPVHQEHQLEKDTQEHAQGEKDQHKEPVYVSVSNEPPPNCNTNEHDDSDRVIMLPIVHEPVHEEPVFVKPTYNKPIYVEPVVQADPKQSVEPPLSAAARPKQQVVTVKPVDKVAPLYTLLKGSLFKDVRGKQLLQRLEQESADEEFSEFLQAMGSFLAFEGEGVLASFCAKNRCVLRDLKRSKRRCSSLMLSFECVPRQRTVDSKREIRQLQKRCRSLKGADGCRFVERLNDLCRKIHGTLAHKPCLSGTARAVVESWLYEHDLALAVELKYGDYRLFSQQAM